MRLIRFFASIALLGCLCLTGQVQTLAQGSAQRQLEQAAAIEDPAERIVALKDFIKDNPDGALSAAAREQVVRSWAQMAEQQLADNNSGRAVEHFRKAIAELPSEMSDKFYEETVARIPFVMSARGYRAESIELARVLETRFAKEPLRLGALGEFYMNLEAPGEAIRALEAAVKLSPEEVRLRRPLASAYRMGLRLEDAAREYEQVAALDAADSRALSELGNLARARGDYDEAKRFYRSQLRIDNRQLAALKGLALTALAEGNEEGAEQHLQTVRQAKGAAELDNDLYLQTQKAFYYLAMQKNDKAAEAAIKALTLEPRYSWTRLAAAEVDMAAGRPFEAEKHLLAALRNADFPTLRFTLGKLYLSVEDFDDALEQFARFITLTPAGKFKARLGGVVEAEADTLKELLARERQAAIFVANPPVTDEQFRMAEALVRFDAKLRAPKAAADAAPRRGRTVRESAATLDSLAIAFIDAEGARRAFRSLYAARRLTESGQSLPLALKLTDQVIDLSEPATAADGSLLEFPNYDREARLRVLRGRALYIKGWALAQLKRNREAMTALAESIDAFGGMSEAKQSIWRLGALRETVGEDSEALTLYLAAYEPPGDPNSIDLKRSLIEALYKKVHGNLDGLDAKIGAAPKVAASAPARANKGAANTSTPVSSPASEAGEKEALNGPAPAPEIANLPDARTETVDLAMRMPTMGKGSYSGSSLLVKGNPIRPSSVGRPDSIVDPIAPSEREAPALASRRMSPRLMRRSEEKLTDAPAVTTPAVKTDESPVVADPPSVDAVARRENSALSARRVGSRLLRWPTGSSLEAAIKPVEIALEKPAPSEESRGTEGTRPRVVSTPSSRPRITAAPTPPGENTEPAGSTRTRRVGKP